MTTSQNNSETEKTYQFDADINQLMKLIINSVYSERRDPKPPARIIVFTLQSKK